MASPEASAASVIAPLSGVVPEGVFEALSSPLHGWKKFSKKEGVTPKGKGVIYITPDSEEIRSKRQMKKYLKGHPGGPTAAASDWTSGESPRRSLRLSSKGRLSSDSLEAQAELPVTKRSKRVVVPDTAKDTVSLVVAATGRNGRAKQTVAASVAAGNEEEMQDVKKDTEPAKEVEATEETADGEKVNGQQTEVSVSVGNEIVKDIEGEKGASAVADEPVQMDVDVVSSSAINGDVSLEAANKKTMETVPSGEDPTSNREEKEDAVLASEVRLKESAVRGVAIQNGEKAEVDDGLGGAQVVRPESVPSAEPLPKKSSAVEEEQTATEPKSDMNVNVIKEILDQQITDFLTKERPEEEPKENGADDMDARMNDDDGQQEVKSKAVDLPQGIHGLVDDSATFGPGSKPQEEVTPRALSDPPQPVGIST